MEMGCLPVASTKFVFMNLTFVHTALFVEIVDLATKGIPLQLPTVRWSAQAFARKTGSPLDQADEGRKVKIIPRKQACPQVMSPLSSECPLVRRHKAVIRRHRG